MANQETYAQTIRELSDRLVAVQRPIRILDAIKWDASVQEGFFGKGSRELPPVDRTYYEGRALPFDAGEKIREFQDLEREINRSVGQFNPVGVIMKRMCREYESVVRMLEARGLPEFSRLSRQLYGSTGDAFHAGDPTLLDFGVMMSEALSNIDRSKLGQPEEKNITAEQAVAMLQERLDRSFPPTEYPVRVMLSDGIIADAAAGSDYLKIRGDARFNERDIRLLEIHEGWVHLGTTVNGKCQPVCTFLSVGPPSSTVTQEGLAILMEIIGFASHPERLRRVTNRIRSIHMAESGADFLEVFRFYREQGYSESESYAGAARVFRGSTPDGGPFTKDVCYSRGFVLVFNFIQLAVRKGRLEGIPLLFCGKTTLEDLKTFGQLRDEGILAPPRILPPQFTDLRALSAWLCYSSFINRLSLDRVEADYANLL